MNVVDLKIWLWWETKINWWNLMKTLIYKGKSISYSISINEILFTEFTTVKFSKNLNSMQKMSRHWNQQHNSFSKAIECLEKSNTPMNTKH